jgi:SAM-dependent methyltransferase
MNRRSLLDELKSKVLAALTLERSMTEWRRTGASGRVLLVMVLLCACLEASQVPSLAPFVGTPPDVVERMLTLARTKPGDTVYDLGCGDGRIVIMAAARFGARGVGIDIDPALLAKAEEAARAAGVSDRVTFRRQDAMTVDVSDASVVTLYLLAASNAKLRPILTAKLAAGARIVAHNYPIGGDWEPSVIDNFTDAAGTMRTLYLWIADGHPH